MLEETTYCSFHWMTYEAETNEDIVIMQFLQEIKPQRNWLEALMTKAGKVHYANHHLYC